MVKEKGSWLTSRPDIKVFDCTIRDGGLINNHNFDEAFVKAVYYANVAAGVDYMEFGYKGSQKLFSPTEHGQWKFCTEDDIRRIVGDNDTDLKLSVMADAERTDYHTDILPKDQSIIDVIRVATYIHQLPIAIDMIKDAHDKGYYTTINIMAISTVQEKDLMEALDILAKTPVDVIYVVDSFGSFYSEQIAYFSKMYSKAIEGTDKLLGIHTHNNQQLAYANTIEALLNGVSLLDVTINGMGRGAGNCPTELLLGFLRNPKFKQRPILECIQQYFLPMIKEGVDWGYSIPYMITGQLNQHPRTAIKMRSSAAPDDYVGFYDQMVEKE